MSVQVHLVRHCEHDDFGRVLTGRGAGGALTPEGRDRASRLARMPNWAAVTAIHASPRVRARETAAAIAAPLGLEVEIVEALDEIDFGTWTGRGFDDLADLPEWREWNERRDTACPPDGEPMAAAVARAVAHLGAPLRQDRDVAIVCVSHCDIIRGVIAHYLGLGLDHLLRFDIDPGSVSTLTIGPWGGQLNMLNRTC